MAASYENNYIFNATIAQIVPMLRDYNICSKLNLELKSENPMPNGVWFRFHHGASFTSWGEKITITLTPASATATNVLIKSECGMPTQVVDWGKNKQVVCNVYEYMDQNITRYLSTAPAPAPIPAPMPAPAPMPVQSANSFCTNCGAAVSTGANFCGKCGTKLN